MVRPWPVRPEVPQPHCLCTEAGETIQHERKSRHAVGLNQFASRRLLSGLTEWTIAHQPNPVPATFAVPLPAYPQCIGIAAVVQAPIVEVTDSPVCPPPEEGIPPPPPLPTNEKTPHPAPALYGMYIGI